MKFEFYDSSSKKMTREVRDSLWDQKVDMDDWDYMLFFSAKYTMEFPQGWGNGEIEPENYNVSRLLNGSARNRWYAVKNFLGKEGFLGIAYHA